MPTLIQINSSLGKGSTGRIVESIGDIMTRAGWDCYVVHGARYIGETRLKSIKVLSRTQEYLHAIGSMLFDRHGLFSVSQTRELVQKLRDLKPDIVQLHSIHGYYINYKILFNFLNEINVPVVWTLHDCWAFTGHCAHFAFSGCNKWLTGCHHCRLLKDYPKSLLLDNSENNWRQKRECFTSVDNMHIIAVSNWLGDLAKRSFMQKYPMQVIYNGVDLDVFKPVDNDIRRRYAISSDDIMVLGVATSWGTGKGLDDFVRLSKVDGVRIVLVGVSDELERTLPKNIIMVNRTESQQNLAEFYAAADMFVNPTYNDSFPTVNLEALACGTPVITYRTGGSPEAIDDETGVVVEQGDYQGLLDMVRLFAETSFKERHTYACRKRAEKFFNRNKQFDEYRKLYEALLTHNQ